MTDHVWDDNEWPIAYLITIRTYGTWLHGDDRLSVDRHGKNLYGSQRIPSDPKFRSKMIENQKNPSFILTGKFRGIVRASITDVCEARGHRTIAINVRTNHVHCVVSAAQKPEALIIGFKANCTRRLREKGLLSSDAQVWSRGGSRRYLWKPHHVERAVDYVLNEQGDTLPDF
jgi:REP element-mobilizing transposase RayT